MPSPFLDPEETKRHDALEFDFARGALKDRVFLVAGGAGGLGAATTALLLMEGAHPILGFRENRTRAESVRQRLEARYGGAVTLFQGDIRDEAARQRFLETAVQARGRVDGLVVFTGDPARSKTEDLGAEAFRDALDRNTVAPLLLARDVALAMRARSTPGAIVLLSSMQGTYPFEGSLAYGTSKAALVHGARVLAKDFGGPDRININVVAPGVTVVGMARTSVDSGKYDGMIDRGIIARFGRPENVARAVCLLLHPESYITGQVMVVDGGLTLRRDTAS